MARLNLTGIVSVTRGPGVLTTNGTWNGLVGMLVRRVSSEAISG